MVERPPPPDLPLRSPAIEPRALVLTALRFAIYPVIGTGLLIWHVVFDPDPVDGKVLLACGALMGLLPVGVVNAVVKKWLLLGLDEEDRK